MYIIFCIAKNYDNNNHSNLNLNLVGLPLLSNFIDGKLTGAHGFACCRCLEDLSCHEWCIFTVRRVILDSVEEPNCTAWFLNHKMANMLDNFLTVNVEGNVGIRSQYDIEILMIFRNFCIILECKNWQKLCHYIAVQFHPI